MSENRNCTGCGSVIPKDARLGLCPKCLLGLGFPAEHEPPTHLEQSFGEPGRRFGDYELGRQLGRGGMGVVYEALQVSLRRPVALKMILDSQVTSPVARRRFTIEAEAAAKLDHPNIVPIYEIGEHEEQPFLSMKLIEGESLRRKIKQGEFRLFGKDGKANSSDVRAQQAAIAKLIASIARAVDHAHKHGVLHRDLKPGNIMVDAQGQPHLTDFGLAKILDDPQGEGGLPALTLSGMALGTPSYMSPEQASGQRLTAASDIYSLGAILYELLTGEPPFKAESPLETMRMVLDQEAKRPRSLHRWMDKDLDTICMKCLEKKPENRYNSAETLAEDLERWLRGETIQARAAGLALRVSRWAKRNPVGAALILTLFAGLGITLFLLNLAHERQWRLGLVSANITAGFARDIEELWKNPEKTSVTIQSEWLSALAQRPPRLVKSDADRLTFGLNISDDPIGRAINYGELLGVVEERMEKMLKRPICLDLVFYKSSHSGVDAIINKEVDFRRLGVLSYMQAKGISPGLQLVARQDAEREGVVFARAGAGVRQLSDLAGRRIAFAHANSIISFWAKVHLVRAGIKPAQLAFYQEFNSLVSSEEKADDEEDEGRFAHYEVIKKVLAGEFDAGEAQRRHFSKYGKGLLVVLASFPVTSDLIVAREGLPPEVVRAFQQSLFSLKSKKDKAMLAKLHAYNTQGFLPVSDTFFSDLRAAQTNEVAQFDKDQPAPPRHPASPSAK